jgi:sphingomyelin phosphodiesterase
MVKVCFLKSHTFPVIFSFIVVEKSRLQTFPLSLALCSRSFERFVNFASVGILVRSNSFSLFCVQDLDYIIWTGDLPPHDVWNQTKDDQLHVLKETVAQLAHYFPNVPIFPSLGNHESTPVNSFPPPYVDSAEFSVQWLYDELDAQWRRWLPESTSQTVRYGGYYSVSVRPGFRIISLNMNYCHNKNWWLLLNTTDPAQELQWLIYELQAAELSGDLVHILGHIPPGHPDCLKTWSRNFYKVYNLHLNLSIC